MLESLAHYKILDRIGAGGMGEVYRARDTRLGRTVAIKVLASDFAADPERRERFLREARASAALSHPNIAALYEIGEDQGHLFLAFEFVPGETLKNVIGGRPLHPRRAVDFAAQVADALADAHGAGIVHRDIKSENIIITPKDKAKVLDFGLATWTAGGAERQHAAEAATTMGTAVGTTIGTVAYMSPEQALGERVDHRTDIFSLGIVLFEMLTGRLPFTGNTATAVALQIVQAPSARPSTINRSVPAELDTVVMKALAKSLEQRYNSAATMAAELFSVAAILDVRTELSESAGPPAAAVSVPRRRRLPLGSILLLLVIAGIGAAGWTQRDALQRLWRRTLGPAPPPIIAVVPLELAGEDASQIYVADGLTEDLITRLGQTPGLKVLGRSATRDYRGRPPREVARELGAGAVLTGTFRPSADAVKISLELIDPSDGTAVWSNQYTRELKDIFAVQAEIADEVAGALRVELQPTPSSTRARSRLVDQRAYRLYLQGRQAAAARRLPEAMKLFEEAMAADAGLAEAFAGLAETIHLDMGFAGQPDRPALRQRMKAAAERAAQLEPDLPQAHLALSLSADSLNDTLGHLRRAVEIDPSYSEAYHHIGDQTLDFDPPLATEFFRRALALDPRLQITHIDIAIADLIQARFEEARRELATPSSDAMVKGLQQTLASVIDTFDGHADRAVAALRDNPALRNAPPLWALYVRSLQATGQTAEAMREAAGLAAKFAADCQGRALYAALLADSGQSRMAASLARPLLAEAEAQTAAASAVRCGVGAAAALGDSASASALLQRIAGNEYLLRYWALEIMGQTGSMALGGRLYPWNKLIDRPEMAGARQALDAAYTREREVARSVLKF